MGIVLYTFAITMAMFTLNRQLDELSFEHSITVRVVKDTRELLEKSQIDVYMLASKVQQLEEIHIKEDKKLRPSYQIVGE